VAGREPAGEKSGGDEHDGGEGKGDGIHFHTSEQLCPYVPSGRQPIRTTSPGVRERRAAKIAGT
jgi:hypothetical protein